MDAEGKDAKGMGAKAIEAKGNELNGLDAEGMGTEGVDIKELLSHVDHTALASCTTWGDVQKLCEEAIRYSMASVCIPPSFVRRAKEAYGDKLAIGTVVGFPLGYTTTRVKQLEAKDALEAGADEIDMVVNLGRVKDGDFDAVEEEIWLLKETCGKKVLKVIVETCCLTPEEKAKLCSCVTKAGADYIKTSTGFGSAGAQLADIELFGQYCGPEIKIKASGGMRTAEDLESFYLAGCDRLGTSSALEALGLEQHGRVRP